MILGHVRSSLLLLLAHWTFAGTTAGGLPNAQEAQLVCMELARRMEERSIDHLKP